MTSVITMANANKNAFTGGQTVVYTSGDGIDITNNVISARVDGSTIVFNSSGQLEAKSTDPGESSFTIHDGPSIFHLSETTIGTSLYQNNHYMYFGNCPTDSLSANSEVVSISLSTPILTTSIITNEGIDYRTDVSHAKVVSSWTGSVWSVPTFTSQVTTFNGESITINHISYSLQSSGPGIIHHSIDYSLLFLRGEITAEGFDVQAQKRIFVKKEV